MVPYLPTGNNGIIASSKKAGSNKEMSRSALQYCYECSLPFNTDILKKKKNLLQLEYVINHNPHSICDWYFSAFSNFHTFATMFTDEKGWQFVMLKLNPIT